jgi:hypothetical protein
MGVPSSSDKEGEAAVLLGPVDPAVPSVPDLCLSDPTEQLPPL